MLVLIKIGENKVLETEYDPLINEFSEKYGLSRALVCAVIETESSFDERAVSSAGASGLMQLMPETFDWILPTIPDGEQRDIFSPRQNIEAGCRYLSYLLKRFSVTETALAAYNAGEGTVKVWLNDPTLSDDGKGLKVIPYPETRIYVERVLSRVNKYEKNDKH